jgi:dihydrofolate reductase
MRTVSFNISMSLDGYINGPDVTPEQGLGRGGDFLHEWAFKGNEQNRKLIEDSLQGVGAIISGRRTYDLSVPYWGADGPSGDLRIPVFVLTHTPPDDVPEGSVYTFVTGGIEDALAQAEAVAGDKTVVVGGGALTFRQYLAAGLVDVLSINLVPVLLGGGTPLFEEGDQTRLELVEVIDTPLATHLRYRVPA